MLAPLAALLGIEIDTITERVRNAIILNTVIAVLGLVGVIFLLVAGFLGLAAEVGAIYAGLILGITFTVLALAIFLGGKIGEGRRKREAAVKRRSSEAGAFMTTAAITALPMLLRSPAIRNIGLPAAAIAAFLLFRGGSDRGDE